MVTRHKQRHDGAVRWALVFCGSVFVGCVVFASIVSGLTVAAIAASAALASVVGALVCVRYLDKGRRR